ncbi:MAG: hypothetical protein K0Q52_87 [Microbacterium sp.]|jgi:hypothetical protein|nr:hypothetical protein [Microbacterium sp.]
MVRIDLSTQLADARLRVETESSGDGADRSAPMYARLTRKETRVREDQYAALGAVARALMRRRQVRTERITENTLIRVAIDALLARKDSLHGSTEAELRESVLSALTDSGTPGVPHSHTPEPPDPGSPTELKPETAENPAPTFRRLDGRAAEAAQQTTRDPS